MCSFIPFALRQSVYPIICSIAYPLSAPLEGEKSSGISSHCDSVKPICDLESFSIPFKLLALLSSRIADGVAGYGCKGKAECMLICVIWFYPRKPLYSDIVSLLSRVPRARVYGVVSTVIEISTPEKWDGVWFSFVLVLFEEIMIMLLNGALSWLTVHLFQAKMCYCVMGVINIKNSVSQDGLDETRRKLGHHFDWQKMMRNYFGAARLWTL